VEPIYDREGALNLNFIVQIDEFKKMPPEKAHIVSPAAESVARPSALTPTD